MLKITPKSANAFDIELLRSDGKRDVVVGKLELYFGGQHLYIFNSEGECLVKTDGSEVKAHHIEIEVVGKKQK